MALFPVENKMYAITSPVNSALTYRYGITMFYINVKGGGADKRAIKVIQPAAGTVGADCRDFARRCLGGELTGKNVPDADVAVIDATFFHHEDFYIDCICLRA